MKILKSELNNTINRIKKETHRLGKIFANHISDKRLKMKAKVLVA